MLPYTPVGVQADDDDDDSAHRQCCWKTTTSIISLGSVKKPLVMKSRSVDSAQGSFYTICFGSTDDDVIVTSQAVLGHLWKTASGLHFTSYTQGTTGVKKQNGVANASTDIISNMQKKLCFRVETHFKLHTTFHSDQKIHMDIDILCFHMVFILNLSYLHYQTHPKREKVTPKQLPPIF